MEAKLGLWANEIAQAHYSKLLGGFWPAAAAILFFSVSLCAYRLCKIKQDKSGDSTGMTTCFKTLLGLVLFSVALTYLSPAGIIQTVVGVVSLLVTILCTVLILRGIPLGVLFLILYAWCGWLALTIYRFGAVVCDRAALETFAVSQRLPAYVSGDISLMSMLLMELLMGLASVWLITNYRKLLNGKKEEEVKSLGEKVNDKIKSKAEKPLKDMKKSAKAAVIVILLLIVPVKLGSATSAFTTGSAAVTNAFISSVVEYKKTPEVAKDADYLQRLDSSYDDLWNYNCRIFTFNARALREADFTFTYLQSDAMVQQLLAMNNIYDGIMADDSESVSLAGSYFDATNALMTSAASRALGEALTITSHPFRSLWMLCTDAFRFYTSFVPLPALAGIFALLGAVLCILSLRSGYVKRLVPKDLSLKLRASWTNLQMPKWMAAIVIVGVILNLSVIFAPAQTSGEPTYADKVKTAFFDKGAAALEAITRYPGSYDEAQLANMVDALTEHALALDDFLTVSPEEGQEALHETLTDSARSMKVYISTLLEDLSHKHMDPDIRAGYISLEVTAMRQCVPLYYNVAVSATESLL